MRIDDQQFCHRPSMYKIAIPLLLSVFLSSCANTPMAPSTAVSDLAPTGKLRAAINFGNPVLASKDKATGEAKGVSVDLSRELARRLGVALELVTYDAAGKVVDAVKSGVWDVAYVAIDPVRANEISYSAAYVVIEGVYLVRQDSPIRENAEVDRAGVRVGVGTGSAYDLYLTRELKQAKIVRAPTSQMVADMVVAQGVEVAAGVKQTMESEAKRLPGVRLLGGRFMVINQAMGTPKGREAGAKYLREFIEKMKASGFVARALARHNIEGAAVAPAAK
jgi:polar amino acid transport system substrate-binding protein